MYTSLVPANVLWKVIAMFAVSVVPEALADDAAAEIEHWLFFRTEELPGVALVQVDVLSLASQIRLLALS